MNLKEFFEINPKCAIGFSGGVDSSYLLYAGKFYGADIKPYYVKTAFQPDFETEDAIRLCKELDIELKIITLDVLSFDVVTANPKNRCYYCKKNIFGTLKNQALSDGYEVLLDGTNASDDVDDRPGMKAIEEIKVLSPLRMCGLTKAKIRELSKEANLFTHDKPAYACLATRVPTGVKIDKETLLAVEKSEGFLAKEGFSDFRVRVFNNSARIQLKESQLQLLIEKREIVLENIKKYFKNVFLDLEIR